MGDLDESDEAFLRTLEDGRSAVAGDDITVVAGGHGGDGPSPGLTEANPEAAMCLALTIVRSEKQDNISSANAPLDSKFVQTH